MSKNVLLSLKLKGILKYKDISNKIISEAYLIRLDEYENVIKSKQAFKTIYRVIKRMRHICILDEQFFLKFSCKF